MAKSEALDGCWAAGFCYHADDRTTRTVGTGATLGGLDGIVTRKSQGRAGKVARVCDSAALVIVTLCGTTARNNTFSEALVFH